MENQNQKTLTVKINKSGKTVQVDWETLPEASKWYLINYGIRQVLNDAHSAEKDPELAQALVDKKLESLRQGRITAIRSSTSAWEKHMLVALSNATNIKISALREKFKGNENHLVQVYSNLCVKLGTSLEVERTNFERSQNVKENFNLMDLEI